MSGFSAAVCGELEDLFTQADYGPPIPRSEDETSALCMDTYTEVPTEPRPTAQKKTIALERLQNHFSFKHPWYVEHADIIEGALAFLSLGAVFLGATGCGVSVGVDLDHDEDNDGYKYDGIPADCDDYNSAVNPEKAEIPYDDIDQDCSGEDLIDVDQDGQSAANKGGTDCNDQNPAIFSGAVETCNGIDDDCDTQIDEGVLITSYPDADGDGMGNGDLAIQECSVSPGHVKTSDDCDDQNSAVHPDAVEVCNETDDNCDGSIDEGVQNTYYRDADGDGRGNILETIAACSVPPGYVDSSDDCDDSLASIYLGAMEVPYDGVDQNCDGADLNDVDGDSYVAVEADGDDCNDADASIYPGATEIPDDGIDQDCSGADEILNTTVGCGGDFGTIQGAIDAVSSGATIEVCEGTYPEQLRIDKTLSIHGTDAVVIDGVDTPFCEPFIEIWDEAHVSFDGIQFTRGGGISMNDGSGDIELNILNSSFYNNQASGCNEFALLEAWNTGPGTLVNLSNTIFENNEGQIGAFLDISVTMSDIIVRDNSAEYIIMDAYDSSLMIENALFENNTVNAGCLLCLQESGWETSETAINGSSFIGNSGLRSSAIYMLFGATAMVTDCLFSSNISMNDATEYRAAVGILFEEGDGTSFESVNTVWESNVSHDVFMQQSGGTFTYSYNADGMTNFLCLTDEGTCE